MGGGALHLRANLLGGGPGRGGGGASLRRGPALQSGVDVARGEQGRMEGSPLFRHRLGPSGQRLRGAWTRRGSQDFDGGGLFKRSNLVSPGGGNRHDVARVGNELKLGASRAEPEHVVGGGTLVAPDQTG